MRTLDQLRLGLTIAITLLAWGVLVWQHFNGGVSAHHLLHDPDLPSISNWWGGLLLPVLVWSLLSLAKRRIGRGDGRIQPVLIGLLGGLAIGAGIAITFTLGLDSVTPILFFGLLPLSLLLPVYRPECLLGFVLAMTVAFGAVLPTIFGVIMASACFLMHHLIGLPLMRLLGLRNATGRRPKAPNTQIP